MAFAKHQQTKTNVQCENIAILNPKEHIWTHGVKYKSDIDLPAIIKAIKYVLNWFLWLLNQPKMAWTPT